MPGRSTVAVHAGRDVHPSRAVAPPIYQTATFHAEDAERFARVAVESRGSDFYTHCPATSALDMRGPGETTMDTAAADVSRGHPGLVDMVLAASRVANATVDWPVWTCPRRRPRQTCGVASLGARWRGYRGRHEWR